ncbi:MAG: hypothetical protein HY721_32440 [Planctomycetes bacterium]|nr:hypothetical protein [Planctomycetota bacterium]
MSWSVHRRAVVAASVSLVLGWVGATRVCAQYNTNGFIRTDAWNLLFLDQAYGSDLIAYPGNTPPFIPWPGGGPAFATANWVAPHDIGMEDPKAGDNWADVAFVATPNPGPRSWTMTPLGASPTWTDYASLGPLAAAALPSAITLPAVGDVVNFQDLTNAIRQFPDPDLASGVTDNAVAIATTYVRNNTGAPVYVRIGSASDDGIRVMVNNLNVTVKTVGRGVPTITVHNPATINPEFEEYGGAILPPGISKITVHVWEGGGGWGLRLGIIKDDVLLKDENGMIDFLGTGFGDAAIVGQAMAADAFAFKDVNPWGWILARGWNLLGPLDQRFGNTGGGPQNLLRDWLLPYDITREDPKSGDVWDIDFTRAGVQGYAARNFSMAIGQGDKPTWFTFEDLNDIAAALGGAALLPLPGSGEGRATGGGTAPNTGIKGTTNTSYARGEVHVDDMLRFINARLARPAGLPTIDLKNCPGVRGDGSPDIAQDCDPDNHLVVATTYVRNVTGADLPVDVVVGTDDSCQVWVNCQLVDNTSFGRGFGVFGSDIRPAVLPPGISKIALLDFEGGGDSGFRLALRAPGSNYNMADGDPRVEFLGHGSGDDSIVGTDQFCLERQVSDPEHRCFDTATVTLKGNGEGNAGDAITVVERISAYDLAQVDITDVSHGGAVTETVVNDAYISVASTGGDVWARCDSFEFDYSILNGDFDVSIELLLNRGYSGDESLQQHGKIGLMARENLNDNSQYQAMQDHGPNPLDGARTSRRRASLPLQANTTAPCGNVREDGALGDGNALRHPRFFRIKRAGQVITTWSSNLAGLADGSLSATVDANWNLSLSDNWNAASNGATAANPLPADLCVGFFNSEHNQFFADVQRVVYRILPSSNAGGNPVTEWSASVLVGTDGGGMSGTTKGSAVVDKYITWNVTRGDANAGLSYEIKNNLMGRVTFPPVRTTVFATNVPRVAGGPPINARLDSYALNFFPDQSGPVGDLESSHDIGFLLDPRTPGSTEYDPDTGSYVLKGSGTDIWDGGDRLHFAYKEVEGDFSIQVRITDIVNPPNARWGRAGIMARYTCDHNSKYSAATVPYRGEAPDADDSRRHQSRRDHLINGTTRDQQVLPSGLLSHAYLGWVRLTRLGNVVMSHFADDAGGEPDAWHFAGSDYDAQRPAKLLVGLVASSHNTAGPYGVNLLEVTYDNLSIEAASAAATTCSLDDPVVGGDFEDPLQIDPSIAAIVVGGGTFTPAIVDGRLRLTQDGTGSSAVAVWFNGDGLVLGDTGFKADFDAYISKAGGADPADGFTFAAVEGTFDTAGGLVGDGGGSLGYNRGDHNAVPANSRRKSLAVEIDTWDGGLGDNDPLQKGANVGLDNVYHMGIDVNFEVQSSQNNVEYGKVLPPLYFQPGGYYNASEGIHVEVTYDPADRVTDSSLVEVWVTANDGSFERTKVLSTRSTILTGDIFLGFTAGTGGAHATVEVDNFIVRPNCCELIDTAAIAQQGTVNLATQSLVTLDGSGSSGADGSSIYKWEVVSGSAELVGPTNIAMPQLQLNGTGDVTVKLLHGDAVCADTASATMTFGVVCEEEAEVASITVPPGPHEVGSTVVLDSAGSSTGGRSWSIVSGSGQVVGPSDGDTVQVKGNEAGDVVVGLTVDDGVCDNEGSAQATVTFEILVNWKRCDSNGSKVLDMSDAVYTLSFLFLGGPASACPGSLDCNVDDKSDLSDAVYMLGVLFLGTGIPDFWDTCEKFPDCPTDCP